MISIVLVTCNRRHLLEACLKNVLGRLSEETGQIVIWNNASVDGTRELLDAFDDPRAQVIHSEENLGTNAFARAFKLARGEHLIELDDDIIDAPENWDRIMREAFDALPGFGFLAAACVDDGKSVASEIMYRRDAHKYTPQTINGVNILDGPTGGWCSITSREAYEKAGGFVENEKFIFWQEDGAFVKALADAGYRSAVLADLKVFHASGPAYSSHESFEQAKARYYRWRDANRNRRKAVKSALERIPGVRRLNQKHGWWVSAAEA